MADVQEAGPAVVSPGDMSKEDKEAMLNRKMEEIRRKNEALLKRHQEVEADRRTAEKTGSSIPVKGGAAVVVSPTTKTTKMCMTEQTGEDHHGGVVGAEGAPGETSHPSHQAHNGYLKNRGTPESNGNPKNRGNPEVPGSLLELRRIPFHRSHQGSPEAQALGGAGGGTGGRGAAVVAEKTQKLRRQGPLPEAVEDRHQGSRRSAMNWGGKDFDGVKHGMEQLKKQQKQGRYHQRGSRDKMDMTLSMTGRERKEYEEWRQERERIDRERLERHRTAGGEWKREWDQEKLDGNVEPADVLAPSQPTLGAWIETSGRQRGGKRIGSGRFPAADSNQPRRPERDRKGDRHEEGEGRRKQRRRTRSLKGDKAEKAAAEGLTVTVQGENRKVENKENNREQAEVADAQETANTPMEEAPPSPTNPMSPTSPLELRTPPDHVHVADWAVEMGESGSGSLSGDWGDECRRRHRTGSDSAPGQGVSGEDITTEVPSKDEHDVLTPVQDSSAGQTKASDSSEVSSPSESVSTSEEVTPTNQEAPAIPSEELVKQDAAVKAEDSPVTAAEPSTVNAEDVKETAVPVAETTVEAAKSPEAVAEPAEPTSEDMTVLRTETQDAEKSPTESTGEQAEDSAPAEGEERDHSEDVREGESPPPTLEPSLSDCEFPLSDAESSCGAINISDYNTVAYTKKTSP
ncbi:protein of unknown function (DUF4594) [Branchiostoma belcheri]|nr:protein of unknown function (DUF4594) [Branchiostoma belcheri]